MNSEASKELPDSARLAAAPILSRLDQCVSTQEVTEVQRDLYNLFRNRVYRLAVRMVGNENADDVAQQIWLCLFKNLSKFKGTSSFETWMYRLAVNECLQFRRKHSRRAFVLLESDPIDEKPLSNGRDDAEILQLALNRLSDELKLIFELREIEKLSYSELSDALQISEGTVASRLSRARLELRGHLVDLGWEESS